MSIMLTRAFIFLSNETHAAPWTLATALRTPHLYDHNKHGCSAPHSLITLDCQPPR